MGVAAITNNSAIPFLLTADFNVDSEVVNESAELDILKAVTITPENGKTTCFSSQAAQGTAIDYVVCSRMIAPKCGNLS